MGHQQVNTDKMLYESNGTISEQNGLLGKRKYGENRPGRTTIVFTHQIVVYI